MVFAELGEVGVGLEGVVLLMGRAGLLVSRYGWAVVKDVYAAVMEFCCESGHGLSSDKPRARICLLKQNSKCL